MCGPDGRTSINGTPVWWCDGPYCRQHSKPVHACAEAMAERGYVLALSADKTLELQRAVSDMPLIGVDTAVVAATPQTLAASTDTTIAEGETKLAAWGLQYETIDDAEGEQDDMTSEQATEQTDEQYETVGDVSAELVESLVDDSVNETDESAPLVDESAPLVDEEVETHAPDDSTD